MERLVLSDAAWERMAPLIIGRPDQKGSTGRDNRMFVEPHRTSQAANGHMYLGAQATARAADRLIFRPPFFAPAACLVYARAFGTLRLHATELDARKYASCSDRKSVKRRQGLKTRLHVPKIDFGLQKRDFVIQPAFVDVDIP